MSHGHTIHNNFGLIIVGQNPNQITCATSTSCFRDDILRIPMINRRNIGENMIASADRYRNICTLRT